MPARRTIEVELLTRVEGEGALKITLRDRRVDQVQLRIYEPPRFFEALLVGRRAEEAPDLTARICGICPVAYQMSAVHALERAGGIEVGDPLGALRRLLYCGEWIESHALHIFLLHAPDFLGLASGLELARDHPELVARALELKQTGNQVVRAIGGREIHPINVRVGGFYRAPSAAELAPLVPRLERAREFALEAVGWCAALPAPDFELDHEFVALRHPDEYPLNRGRIVSSRGLDLDPSDYEDQFIEEQVRHSHALQSRIRGRGGYLVGPLARFNLNFDRLPALIQQAARDAGLTPPCRNPFRGIVVRALETAYACDEALRLLRSYMPPASPALPYRAGPSTGWACTEAPRGLLYHRYRIDEHGLIASCKIVPPTAQNQGAIEADLRGLVEAHQDLAHESLTRRCEQAIRNYDPCISCATHFLRLELESQP